MTIDDFNTAVEETLRGSFDLHVHAAPDPTYQRRLDALDAARYAQEAEMGGFVLKSHEYPTAPLTYALNRMYPGLTVVGSITLNSAVGGLNPEAVQTAANLGAKVVWMPTESADFFRRGQGTGPGIRLLTDDGALHESVHQIIEIVASKDMVLASGHASPAETMALFKAAKASGVTRMIATHPRDAATIEELREMASVGVYIEFTFADCMPSEKITTPEDMVAALRTLGVEHCLVTTDFGQWLNPPPSEGMRMAIAALMDVGMSSDDVAVLVKHNPAKLLGLNP